MQKPAWLWSGRVCGGGIVALLFRLFEIKPVYVRYWQWKILCFSRPMNILNVREDLRAEEAVLSHIPRILTVGLWQLGGTHLFSCVRACVRACVCVLCMRACVRVQPGKNILKFSAMAWNWTRATGRTDNEIESFFHWPVMTDFYVSYHNSYLLIRNFSAYTYIKRILPPTHTAVLFL